MRRLPSREEILPEDWALAHTIHEGVTVADELLEIDAFDGVTRTVLNFTAPVLDENGNIDGAIVVNQDVTERVRAEETRLALVASLREQQRLESIGTLARGVAHEINNPLMGMLGYAELVKDRVEDPKALDYLKEIDIEGKRIATIVQHLLVFSQHAKQSHSLAEIKDIINGSLTLVGSLFRMDHIALELNVPENLPQVTCRSQQIQQVVINLLTNARDALNERYPECDANKLVRITVRPFVKDGEPWVRVTIEDHGSGISEDVAQRIFDPFFSTKPRHEGTGLGLSLSYGIVKDHHGDLTVERKPGTCTRFHVDLPVSNESTLRDKEPTAGL